jgi:hypothetical protein
MQTAPAASQKTPKVAKDELLSAHEPSSGPGERQQGDWQLGYQQEHGPSAVRQALPETRSVVANRREPLTGT